MKEQRMHLLAAAVTYCGNLAFTNESFLRGSTPFTETIKSTEPVVVSMLAITALGEKLTLVGLLAVCCISAGTAIACISDTLIVTFGGGLFAVMAVVCQGASAVCVKLLNQVQVQVVVKRPVLPSTEQGKSPAHAVESEESGQLLHRTQFKDPSGSTPKADAAQSGSFRDPEVAEAATMSETRPVHPAMLFLYVSIWSVAASGLYCVFVGEKGAEAFLGSVSAVLFGQREPTPQETSDTLALLGLLGFNSVCYVSYNLAAYFVLRRTSATNYAVLNSLRRVLVIVVSTFVFGMSFTVLSLIGIVVAFLGFTFHAYRNTGISVSDCFISVHKRIFKWQNRVL